MCLTNVDCLAFLFLKTKLTMVALKIYSDIVGTKGNSVAAVLLFDVDYSTKAEFEGHAAVNETVAVQTATKT